MSLINYRSLGHSGLIVSPMALGTMTFGDPSWGADKSAAREIFKAYTGKGGNFIDTADVYAAGVSEEMVGEFISEMNLRDQVVLATKFAFNGASSPLSSQRSMGNPNAGGCGAKNIHRALEGSLKRLKTDYIDLYWMHIWDGVTPVEEIVQTLQNLVASGKIRYYALSDMPAWFATKAAVLSQSRGRAQPIAMQFEYSLVARDVEREHVPAARNCGMSIVPWSPLAGGFLSGKYKEADTSGTGRLSGPNPFGDSKFSVQNWAILSEIQRISKLNNCMPAQVALSWLINRPGVASTVIGARTVSQLNDNLKALDIDLSSESIEDLNRISSRPLAFADTLDSPQIRQMVYGGNQVTGWRESHTSFKDLSN